ncbi:helix-turn-helix transcriptional regulator [Cytobacillus sp. FSL M8-0252]|uniref:helix-turn-helix domain-containing protein n=1 Tax=Cytobacillus sp. FSL M8-0252 TaxID=2921621 RepID=UPI0030F4D5F4
MIKYRPKKIKILIAMAEKGFNQKSLSEAAGLNQSTLSNFLNGRYGISTRSAKKIADTLDRELGDLFEIEIRELAVRN